MLTNSAIEALKPGQELRDDRVPGLSVRATKSGKSFLLYYRTKGGIQRRPKIGAWGALTIALAREAARGVLARVANGEDPSQQNTVARQEPDMNGLWERCEREHWNNGKDWDKEAKRLYHRNVKPRIGTTRVRAVDYAMVADIHQALKDTPYEGNRTLAVVSKMLKLARRWGLRTGDNPCEDVPRFREMKRRRYAKPVELATIGPVLDRYAQDPDHVSGVAFLYLMLFSGARPSEIANATPDMVEEVLKGNELYGVLRLDNGKTGQRDVFLPPQAIAVLAKLPAGRKRLADRKTLPRRLWELVRKEAGCEDLWARDLRRTFATVALSNGVPIGQVGELLGHASTATTKIYAKLMEDPAHKASADTAGKLEEMLGAGK
jgi:integrase